MLKSHVKYFTWRLFGTVATLAKVCKGGLGHHNDIGKMFCRVMKLKFNNLGGTNRTYFGIKRALHINLKT